MLVYPLDQAFHSMLGSLTPNPRGVAPVGRSAGEGLAPPQAPDAAVPPVHLLKPGGGESPCPASLWLVVIRLLRGITSPGDKISACFSAYAMRKVRKLACFFHIVTALSFVIALGSDRPNHKARKLKPDEAIT